VPDPANLQESPQTAKIRKNSGTGEDPYAGTDPFNLGALEEHGAVNQVWTWPIPGRSTYVHPLQDTIED
jgi:hypothetical protein